MAALSTATTARGSTLLSPNAAARFRVPQTARFPAKSPNSRTRFLGKGGGGVAISRAERVTGSPPSVRRSVLEPTDSDAGVTLSAEETTDAVSVLTEVGGSRHPFFKGSVVALCSLAMQEGGTTALEICAGAKGAGGVVLNERGAAPVHSSITASTCS